MFHKWLLLRLLCVSEFAIIENETHFHFADTLWRFGVLVVNPRNRTEEWYSRAHKHSLSLMVEQIFGTLKAKIRGPDRSGGSLPYSPKRRINIIKGTASVWKWQILVPDDESGDAEEERVIVWQLGLEK